MSVSIILYNMNKKRNSSKQPINTDIYKTVTGNFVEDSSMFAPVFTLSRDEVTNVARFNYFSITWPSDSAVTTRYYWVKDKVVQKDGTLKVLGFEDCFATFRSNISAGSYYVKRSSQSYRDDLIDTSFAIESRNHNKYWEELLAYDETVGSVTNWHAPYENSKDGVYIVGITCPETTQAHSYTAADTSEFKRGGIKYYTFNHNDITSFFEQLNVLQTGALADHKLSDFIVSCIYMPIDVTCFDLSWASSTKSTYFMLTRPADPNDAVGILISNRHYVEGITDIGSKRKVISVNPSNVGVKVNKHPQYSTYGKMMNAAPFTKITFVDPLIGTIDLPSYPLDTFVGYSIEYNVDFVTGYISVYIAGYSVPVDLKSISASVGVPISLVSIAADSYVNRKLAENKKNASIGNAIIGGVSGIVGGAAMGGAWGAIAGGAAGLVSAAVNTAVAKDNYDVSMTLNESYNSDVIGNNGTMTIGSAPHGNCPYIWYRCYDIEDTANFVVHPRLTNKYILGSSLYLNGEFAICENAQLSSNTGLTYDEEQIICDQLNSGFFFE